MCIIFINGSHSIHFVLKIICLKYFRTYFFSSNPMRVLIFVSNHWSIRWKFQSVYRYGFQYNVKSKLFLKKCTVPSPELWYTHIHTHINMFISISKRKRNGIPSANFKGWIYMNELHLLNVAIKGIYVFKDEWASNNVSSCFLLFVSTNICSSMTINIVYVLCGFTFNIYWMC